MRPVCCIGRYRQPIKSALKMAAIRFRSSLCSLRGLPCSLLIRNKKCERRRSRRLRRQVVIHSASASIAISISISALQIAIQRWESGPREKSVMEWVSSAARYVLGHWVLEASIHVILFFCLVLVEIIGSKNRTVDFWD